VKCRMTAGVDERKSSAARGYGYKWQKAREDWLAKHVFCIECERLGRKRVGTVVDHKVPHRGDLKLFWDRKNWQTLCKPCHDSYKQRLEKSGQQPGCSAQGIPADAGHHWNAAG